MALEFKDAKEQLGIKHGVGRWRILTHCFRLTTNFAAKGERSCCRTPQVLLLRTHLRRALDLEERSLPLGKL